MTRKIPQTSPGPEKGFGETRSSVLPTPASLRPRGPFLLLSAPPFLSGASESPPNGFGQGRNRRLGLREETAGSDFSAAVCALSTEPRCLRKGEGLGAEAGSRKAKALP